MDFSNQLILWYLQNKRILPWRKSREPYHIWLSEIILQQTRISQGTPYYLKFISKYPTVSDLAGAEEDDVLKLWQGLGYYSRGRNLHHTAREITKKYKGIFPNDFNELRKLKGIGDYTASAITSICFDMPHATVDGNVYRVLSRFFNIDIPVNTTSGIKYFKKLAQKLLNHEKPGLHNQAVMELGALICTPKKPKCSLCPLQNGCEALKHKLFNRLPVKENRLRKRKRYFNYLILNINNTHTFLVKRTQKDIWQNLFQFPLLETTGDITEDDLIKDKYFRSFVDNKNAEISLFNEKTVLHKLTHQDIYARFWIINTETSVKNSVEWKNVSNFAVPVLIDNFIKSFRK